VFEAETNPTDEHTRHARLILACARRPAVRQHARKPAASCTERGLSTTNSSTVLSGTNTCGPSYADA